MTTHPTPPLGDTGADAMRMVPVELVELDHIAASLSDMGRVSDGNLIIQAAVELAAHRNAAPTAPPSTQPVEAIGAGREEVARIVLREELRCLKPDKFNTAERLDAALNERWGDIDRAQYYATADAILAALSPASPARGDGTTKTMTVNLTDEEMAALEALSSKKDLSGPKIFRDSFRLYQAVEQGAASVTWHESGPLGLPHTDPASPARTPMGEPQVLKGVGKINGDGWKDTTSIGEVVYVWNAEKPSPYAPGQYPRIWNEGWSASTAQYDFSPASIDEVRALAAPTPMGGSGSHRRASPQGEIAQIISCYRNMGPEGDKDAAIQHLCDLFSASPQPEAGEPVIRILCETTSDGVIGTTSLNVVRVEREDDGSFTAVTDHWPVSPSAQPAEDKLRDAISLILPLAKGYAAAHPVGSNQAYVDYVESFVSNEGDAISRPAAPSGGEKRAAIMREVKSYAACDDVGSAQWINALTSRLVEVTK